MFDVRILLLLVVATPAVASIQPLEDWKRKREFQVAFNSKLAAN